MCMNMLSCATNQFNMNVSLIFVCLSDFHLPYLIHQGLNLDDCCTTYDQIERSQAHGPYQDVCNIIEEEEEIQLEKP